MEQILHSVKQNESSDSDLNDTIQNAHETSFETAGSDNDDDDDSGLYVKAFKLNQPQYHDKIYGVRNEKVNFLLLICRLAFILIKLKLTE